MVGILLTATAACDVSSPGVQGTEKGTETGTPSAAPSTGGSAPAESDVPPATAEHPAEHPVKAPVSPLPTHASAGTATVPAVPPVLGMPWAQNQQGYGQVRPATIFNGGDPTGLVQSVTWSSWGGASAVGTGTAEYVGPGQSVADGTEARAEVVAFRLGSCAGKKAYRAIEWYFPAHGQHFDPTRYIDTCTGENHGM